MITFDFTKDFILEDERVLLRPLRTEDFKYLEKFSSQEPELWKYSLLSAAGGENLAKYISVAILNRKNQMEYPFIVFDKLSNQYAGSTRFYDINIPNKTLQLGYTWYGKDFQGTGINKHCKFLMLSFAFEELNMERVEFRADNQNQRSISAMKSIGCTVEGVLRQNVPKADGSRRDSIILSILKNEWFAKVKNDLLEKFE
jgi:N-acetyltransferase